MSVLLSSLMMFVESCDQWIKMFVESRDQWIHTATAYTYRCTAKKTVCTATSEHRTPTRSRATAVGPRPRPSPHAGDGESRNRVRSCQLKMESSVVSVNNPEPTVPATRATTLSLPVQPVSLRES